MSEITYSFIIPHKNCPDLLQRCVDSIPERDDIQIIVVDDNSDADKKPAINRKGVEVILLDAEHSNGAGRARNVALEHAKGKWLMFADADDYFTNFLSGILDKYATDEITDMVFLNARMFNENDETLQFRLNRLVDDYKNHRTNAELLLRYTFWTPWSRMIKRKIITDNHILFDETMARNDKNFILECSSKAVSFEVEKNKIYNYFRPSYGSMTDKKRTVALLDDMVKITSRTNNIYKSANIGLRYSYLEIFYKSSFVAGMGKMDVLVKYISTLWNNKVSVFSDIICYIRKKRMPNNVF